MMPVGSTIKRKADKARFRVLGVDGDGRYVLEPADEFGSPVALSVENVRKLFGAAVEAPPGADPATGWQRLSEAFRRSARAAARGHVPGPTPEDQLKAAAAGTSAAKTVAEGIFASDKLAMYEVGELPTHPDVARALDALIAERNRKAPA